MSKPNLCVEYQVENQNNNQFTAIILLDKNEALKFQQSYDEDRRSPFRKIAVTINDYLPCVSAVVNRVINISNQSYVELQSLNDRSYIGQTNLYHFVCRELLQLVAPTTFVEYNDSDNEENEIVCDILSVEAVEEEEEEEEEEVNVDTDIESVDSEGADAEGEDSEGADDESESVEGAVDNTIHELVYANNFEELATILATGEFSATGKDDQGVQPIYLLDARIEHADKAVLILETLVNFGARLDKAGLGYDNEGQPKEIWLLMEALREGNYHLAATLVQMGHPLVNNDLKKGYLFDVQDFWYSMVGVSENAVEMEM